MVHQKEIVFLNSYVPPDWYPKERRQLCERMLAWLPEYLEDDSFFEGKTINVTFLRGGVSSLVCLVEDKKGEYVLKVPTSSNPKEGATLFFEKWSSANVRAPRVLQTGVREGRTYILMEYIDSPVLSKKFSMQQLLENEYFARIGELLAKMHAPSAEGCGILAAGKAEFRTAREWLASPYVQGDIAYAFKHALVPCEEALFRERIGTYIEYIDQESRTAFCHGDFSASNVFATDPLTVFDPNPMIHHPLFDVACSLLTMVNFDVDTEAANRQLVEGYSALSTTHLEYLSEALLLEACVKFSYWHRIGRTVSLAKAQDFLKMFAR